MLRSTLTIGLVLAALGATGVGQVSAQGLLQIVDDVVIITGKGQNKKEQARTHQHLPGAGESALPTGPGSDIPRLGEPVAVTPVPGVLSAAAAPPGQRYGQGPPPRLVPPGTMPAHRAPLYGPLELPTQEDEGPVNGLTLDTAINHLVQTNYDLLTKYQEIPKAQADILSAGLRLNPFLFASVDNLPYGNYSPQRPGASSYEATIAQPIDVNQKRKVRVRVAEQAKRVLEAQYQDAVRLQIDNLYTAYVDVLEARLSMHAARTGLAGIAELVKTTRTLVDKGLQPRIELDRVSIQQFSAEGVLHAAEVSLAQAKRNLATLLAIPAQFADQLEVRGTLRDTTAPLPATEELIHIALQARPDLMAYRLGVDRAAVAVQLAKKERFEDVFLFYTPYTHTNNAPMGGQNAN